MDNKKDDNHYIRKVLGDLSFLMKHTKDISREAFEHDEVLLDSIMFRFIQISEHIKKLTVQFKSTHDQVPWNSIIGLRNRIVHEYGNVDLNIIYHAVKIDIYVIHELFESIRHDQ